MRLQYTCMFISAGEPGNAKKIQASVAAARKVFRVFGVSFLPTLQHDRPAIKHARARSQLCCLSLAMTTSA